MLEERELSSDLEKWLYILKNMSRLKKILIFLQKPIFQQVFQIAEMSALTKEERMLYDASLKAKRDWNNTVAWAAEEARKEERVKAAEEKYAMQIESAIEMKKDGLSVAQIAKFTKLPLEVIEKL